MPFAIFDKCKRQKTTNNEFKGVFDVDTKKIRDWSQLLSGKRLLKPFEQRIQMSPYSHFATAEKLHFYKGRKAKKLQK